jgi:DUF971 family protein
MTQPIPTEIKRVPTGLIVKWTDGQTDDYTSESLRKGCPCAECREKRGDGSHSAPLTPKKRSLTVIDTTLSEATKLNNVEGVGSYAIRLTWADGHNSGIYTFDYLVQLRKAVVV